MVSRCNPYLEGVGFFPTFIVPLVEWGVQRNTSLIEKGEQSNVTIVDVH